MRTTLTHAGLGTLVSGPDEEVEWLTEFLAPAFTPGPAAPSEPRVHIALDPVPGERRADGSERVAFVLDRGPVRLRGAEGDDVVRYHDDMFGVVIDVETRVSATTLTYGDPRAGRMMLMRVVREHAHNRFLAGGGLMLHAAAVSTPRGAVAITGPRGAGKTTLVLGLLSQPAVTYLSNDRLAVVPGTGHAYGVPTVVAVRHGTRDLLPEMTRRLAVQGDFRDTAAQRAADPSAAPAARDDSWYFAPAQVARAASRVAASTAPLVAVLVLSGRRADHLRTRRLDAAEAGLALADAVLGRRGGCYASEVFSPPPIAIDDRIVTERCDRLAAAVPCYEVSMVEPSDAAALARLLDVCT